MISITEKPLRLHTDLRCGLAAIDSGGRTFAVEKVTYFRVNSRVCARSWYRSYSTRWAEASGCSLQAKHYSSSVVPV